MSKPPATSPMAPPAAETVVNSPIARTRCRALGEDGGEQASEDGAASAAPTPWRAGRRAASTGGGEAAGQRAQREEGDAGEERPAPAEQVAGPGAEEEQPAEGEDVGVEDPRQPVPEKPRPRWMCGRATLTIVASSTTISWAVRITKRKTEGWPRRRRSGPASVGWRPRARRGRRRGAGIDDDLSAGILSQAEASSG